MQPQQLRHQGLVGLGVGGRHHEHEVGLAGDVEGLLHARLAGQPGAQRRDALGVFVLDLQGGDEGGAAARLACVEHRHLAHDHALLAQPPQPALDGRRRQRHPFGQLVGGLGGVFLQQSQQLAVVSVEHVRGSLAAVFAQKPRRAGRIRGVAAQARS